jgi:hypothetical protein
MFIYGPCKVTKIEFYSLYKKKPPVLPLYFQITLVLVPNMAISHKMLTRQKYVDLTTATCSENADLTNYTDENQSQHLGKL